MTDKEIINITNTILKNHYMRIMFAAFLRDIFDKKPSYYDISDLISKDFYIDSIERQLKYKYSLHYKYINEFLHNINANKPTRLSKDEIKQINDNLLFDTSRLIVYFIIEKSVKSQTDKEKLIKVILGRYRPLGSESTNTDRRLGYSNGFITDGWVEIEVIKSLEQYIEYINKVKDENGILSLYYRGHEDINYKLIPSVFREKEKQIAEDVMYKEIELRFPDNFKNCKTLVEKMILMQHFGLPTRLLDVTNNPLVAMYFACCSKNSENPKNGEVIVFCLNDNEEKWYLDDCVTAMTCFAELNSQERYYYKHDTGKRREGVENKLKKIVQSKSLITEWEDLKDKLGKQSYFLKTPLNNPRIIAQSGSMVLCHDGIDKDFLLNYRAATEDQKLRICLIDGKSKKTILEQLDTVGINEATLFPDMQRVANYIAMKAPAEKKAKMDFYDELFGDFGKTIV